MKKVQVNLMMLLMLFSFGIATSGCALFLVGAGAAGGYSISKDEIEGIVDSSYSETWAATKKTINKQGALTLENEDQGLLKAVVEGSTVEARIEQVTKKTVRLRVKARKTKNLFPDIKLAQQIYSQSVRELV